MRNFVDLHAHSAASDGQDSPAQVVELAERKKLAAVALTDHDTVAGIAAAAAAAQGLGVTFIPGIEISVVFAGGTMHMLGLGIDPASPEIKDMAQSLREYRRQRNPKIVAALRAMGIQISLDELVDMVRAERQKFRAAFASPSAGSPSAEEDEMVSRVHFAAWLVQKGHARHRQDAFDRYIAQGAPAYVDKERLAPAEAIQAIHRGGGLAILAHPPQLNYGNLARLERLVADLVEQGLDGIEIYHFDITPLQTRGYLDIARRRGLLVTGGSDYHGRSADRMGRPKVPLAAVKQLLAKLGFSSDTLERR